MDSTLKIDPGLTLKFVSGAVCYRIGQSVKKMCTFFNSDYNAYWLQFRLMLYPVGIIGTSCVNDCLCLIYFVFLSCFTLLLVPPVGSGVVRMDPLRFLAGCRTKRVNQV